MGSLSRKGQIVAATLVTPTKDVTFPIVDTQDSKGGRHYFDTTEERNKMPASHRTPGMVVRVNGAVGKDYILKRSAPTTGNTSDSDWEEYAPGLPPNILTSYQTVDQIAFATPQVKPNKDEAINRLGEYLEWLEEKVNGCLTVHNKVEEIEFANTHNTYTKLSEYLDYLVTQITAAGAIQYIDNTITWQHKPATIYANNLEHKNNLNEELVQIYETMNDPSKINVNQSYNNSSTKTSLQAKLNAIDQHTHPIEEIKTRDGSVTLVSWLELYKDPANCKWDENTSLKAKIESIDNSSASASKIESISWQSTPTDIHRLGFSNDNLLSTNLSYIFAQLALMNKDTNITVYDAEGQNGKTLRDRLNDLVINIAEVESSTTQGIEDIRWNNKPTTPTGLANVSGNGLADQLIALWNKVADLASPSTITIPPNTFGNDGIKTLAEALNDLNNKITGIRVEDLTWRSIHNAGTNTQYGGQDVTLDSTINDIYSGLKTISDNVQAANNKATIDELEWNNKPIETYAQSADGNTDSAYATTSHKSKLSAELKQIYSIINDPTRIPVYTKKTTSGTDANDATTTTLRDKIIQLNTDIATLKTVTSAATNNDMYVKRILLGSDAATDDGTIAAPQYLLFTITEDLDPGPFKSQEYMVAWDCYVDEVVAYLSLDDATHEFSISGALQIAGPGGLDSSAYALYNDDNTTAFYIGPQELVSAPAKPNNLELAKGSRIRVYISNQEQIQLTCLSIRVKLVSTVAHTISI